MAQGTSPMSGPSTATSSRGTFAELVTAARTSGHTQVLPILAGVGIKSIPDLAGRGHIALAAGVDPSAIEDIVSATPRPQVTAPPPRQDLPERHSHQRASMRAAMDAALPNSRKRALDDLDGGIIANSTKGPLESRVRTWQDLCRAWQVQPWPIGIENIRAVAASLKAARYKSALQYFEAAIWHQTHRRPEPFDANLRRLIKSYVRSIRRGMPGTRLKQAFDFTALAKLTRLDQASIPLDVSSTAHLVDMIIVGTWFMLREIEQAAAKGRDLVTTQTTVTLTIPIHKTSQGGQVELTRRNLSCACTAAVHPLCPVHAADRHLRRLRLTGAGYLDGPLFPSSSAAVRSRAEAIQALTQTLQAAGLPTEFADADGTLRPLYGGHALRVTGAQFLAGNGVPVPVVQLLGRWSSKAVERYTQGAPLALAPQVASIALGGRQDDRPQFRAAVPEQALVPQKEAVAEAPIGRLDPPRFRPPTRRFECRQKGVALPRRRRALPHPTASTIHAPRRCMRQTTRKTTSTRRCGQPNAAGGTGVENTSE